MNSDINPILARNAPSITREQIETMFDKAEAKVKPGMPSGEYFVTAIFHVRASGTDEQAKQMIGNMRRFLKLCVVPSTELCEAIIERDDGESVSWSDSDIPVMKM